MSGANQSRIGVACDETSVAIAWRDATGARWHSATFPSDGSPDSVVRALADAALKAPRADAASITLARPLAHTRALVLPRMPRTTLEEVLARDWSRHIIAHRATAHSVTARAADRGRWISAFAPTNLLDALAEATSTHGWRTTVVMTADDALAAAARSNAPEHARAGDCYVTLCDVTGPTAIVHLRNGLPWLGRRLLTGAGAADVAAFMLASPSEAVARAPVVLLGHPTHTKALAGALGAQGMRASAVDLGLAADATAIELLAVAGTNGAPTLALRSSRAQAGDARRMRATTWWISLAAAAAMLAGLGIARWQVQRELADVERGRAEIATPVRSAMAMRSDVETATEIASALAEREANASRVSGVLAAVALALPPGSTLTALRVAGDSVSMEGESARSAAVYAAMRAVPSLEQVALAAPLRQERQAGDVVVERFAFSARIRRGAVR